MDYYFPVSNFFSGPALFVDIKFEGVRDALEFEVAKEDKIESARPILYLENYKETFQHDSIFAGENWVGVIGNGTISLFVDTSSNELIYFQTIYTEER